MTNLKQFPLHKVLHSKIANKALEIYWGDMLICIREFKKSVGKASIKYYNWGDEDLNDYFHSQADKYCNRRLAWIH